MGELGGRGQKGETSSNKEVMEWSIQQWIIVLYKTVFYIWILLNEDILKSSYCKNKQTKTSLDN